MSGQTKKTSKKTKTSPTETELEAQFQGAAQRVKSTRISKATFKSQDGKENFEAFPSFSKDSIPFIDKQIFSDNSLELKDTAPVTSEASATIEDSFNPSLSLDASKEIQENEEEKEANAKIASILDENYMPKKYLYRKEETKQILSFIAR